MPQTFHEKFSSYKHIASYYMINSSKERNEVLGKLIERIGLAENHICVPNIQLIYKVANKNSLKWNQISTNIVNNLSTCDCYTISPLYFPVANMIE